MQFVLLFLLVLISLAVSEKGIVDLDPKAFQNEVVNDDRVWLVEFYSPMCGSCQEFTPTWHKIAQKTKTMVKGQVNIDTKEGMALAEAVGALEEGIPNVRIFTKKGDTRGKPVVKGELENALESAALNIRGHIQGLKKSEANIVLKA